MYRLCLALLLVVGLSNFAFGQTPLGAPKTAAEGLKAVLAYIPQQTDAAKKAGRAWITAPGRPTS